MELGDVWGQAASSSDAGQTRAFRVADSDAVLLLVTLDGRRNLLVPTLGREFEIPPPVEALEVRVGLFVVEGEEKDCVQVTLACEGSEGLFDHFINDLLEGDKTPIEVLASKLAEYQYFWRKPGSAFGPEQAVGLFGELFFLSEWLGTDDLAGAVRQWTGPDRTLRDFTGPRTSVEVKTTRGEEPIHTVSSVLQLAPGPARKLLLFSLLVREDPEGDQSLMAVVDKVSSSLEDGDRYGFLDKLAETGFRPDEAFSDPTRYIITNETLYEVREGFPRIVPTSFLEGNVPSAVSGLTYKIDLSGAADFEAGLEAPISLA